MSTKKWDGLSWWEQQLYLEGYADEGLVQENDDTSYDSRDGSLVDEEVHHSGGTTITDRKYRGVADGGPEDAWSGLAVTGRLD